VGTSYLPGWGPEGGRQAMGGRAIGWDGGKNLQTHRMSPVGESEGDAGVGGWARKIVALFGAAPWGDGGGGS
jgi:hypothetical protein